MIFLGNNLCQCCHKLSAYNKCWNCEKQLCQACGYSYNGNVFCRNNFEECFIKSASSYMVQNESHLSWQVDPIYFRACIKCCHKDLENTICNKDKVNKELVDKS